MSFSGLRIVAQVSNLLYRRLPVGRCAPIEVTMQMQKLIAPFWLSQVLMILLGMSLLADEVAEQGRPIFEKNKQAVVTVQVTLQRKVSVGGVDQAREARRNLTGTVIDPSGLTVLSLSASDPGELLQSFVTQDNAKVNLETEVSDLRMLLPDGTEVPAEFALRDRDLDLAFIRPKTKLEKPMEALDLSASGKAQVLEQVITLSRLGVATGRTYAASVERISAVVREPRLFYVPMSGMTTTGLGSPAFTLDGKVLGIFAVRLARESGAQGTQGSQVSGIILPAEDVLEAAKRVTKNQ